MSSIGKSEDPGFVVFERNYAPELEAFCMLLPLGTGGDGDPPPEGVRIPYAFFGELEPERPLRVR